MRGDGGDVRPANSTQTFCQEDRHMSILVVVVVQANEELGIVKSRVREARVHLWTEESVNRTAESVCTTKYYITIYHKYNTIIFIILLEYLIGSEDLALVGGLHWNTE